MNPIYHILNGDALKERFPSQLDGKIIVARECLVHGNVQGTSLPEFFANRAEFIKQAFQVSKNEYKNSSQSEFEKITSMEDHAQVYLWFEDDLFCQANLWFVIHLLAVYSFKGTIYLVRPPEHACYNFGALSNTELVDCYDQSFRLKQFTDWKQLWPAYQKNDTHQLQHVVQKLNDSYPFLIPTLQAHIDRLPLHDQLNRPQRAVQNIINDLQTTDLGTVLKEFTKREGIYGYGDWQVQQLLEELKDR